MTLNFNIKETEELMRAFYTMSGIRLVLFDTDFHEIASYPKESCEFCKLMRSCKNTRRKCAYTDRKSLEKCEKTNSLVIYSCHAGLIEAVMPLHENENIIGYLMIGQISNNKSKDKLFENAAVWSEKYGFNKTALDSAIEKVSYKSEEEIFAAAKLMEACTSYIVYKELITPEHNRIIKAAKAYIEENLGTDFEISALCGELSVGRTKLYELFKKETKMGISEYLRYRRMHRAKKLLKTTDMPIVKIAETVGFDDYNYFSRVYKKTYGKSPRSYR